MVPWRARVYFLYLYSAFYLLFSYSYSNDKVKTIWGEKNIPYKLATHMINDKNKLNFFHLRSWLLPEPIPFISPQRQNNCSCSHTLLPKTNSEGKISATCTIFRLSEEESRQANSVLLYGFSLSYTVRSRMVMMSTSTV